MREYRYLRYPSRQTLDTARRNNGTRLRDGMFVSFIVSDEEVRLKSISNLFDNRYGRMIDVNHVNTDWLS